MYATEIILPPSVDFILLFGIIIIGEESPQYDLGYSPLPDMRFINGRDEICLPPPDVMRATNSRVSNRKTLLHDCSGVLLYRKGFYIMYIFPGQLVFLNEQYNVDFADKNIMVNSSGRPYFFAFPDLAEPHISWLVPVSSRYEKYSALVRSKIAHQGYCNTIYLGKLLGRDAAFLIQNMIPATEKYISDIYLHKDTAPVQIDQRTAWYIMRNARRVLEKVKKGHSSLVYTDIRSIYAELCCQLYFDDLQQSCEPPRMADQIMAARHHTACQDAPQSNVIREEHKER